MLLTPLFVDAIRTFRRHEPAAAESDRAIRLADKASRSLAPVLIEGEAGTGGDALAQAIHLMSERRAKPFVRVQAGGRADEIRADLFGIDARSGGRHPGRFAEARGGTLLIQGVEELPADAQAGLLRAVQESEIEPVGARRATRVDVRVVATTQVDLAARVRQDLFREDLFYRLHLLPIGLKPLRSRIHDLPRLAAALLPHIAAEQGQPVAALSPEALALLQAYDWPGNLCQLETVLFRAVNLAESPILTPDEFPQVAARLDGRPVAIPPLPQAGAREVAPERHESRDPHALSLVDDSGEIRRLVELEALIIRFALAHYRGRMSAISRRLGIGRSTLYRKLKDLGLDGPEIASRDAAA